MFLRLCRFMNNELLHIDYRRLSLTLFLSLYQTNALGNVKLCQKSACFTRTASYVFRYFLNGIEDINPAQLIVPTVFGREAHAIQKQTV